MSRAFVKDDDDRPEPPIRRIAGDRPNHVTAAGLQGLHDALERARRGGDVRNVDYFEERIANAIVDDPSKHEPGIVAFGSVVTVRDERGAQTKIHVVGEDEADPGAGSISWTSPYAQALLGHRAGQKVVVRRPAGATILTIESILSS